MQTYYKELLRKYLRFIQEVEGSTLLHRIDSGLDKTKFSDEETRTLHKLKSE